MATKAELQAELEVALLDRDQIAQAREEELLERDSEIKDLRAQVRNQAHALEQVTAPIPSTQIRSWGELDAPVEGVVYEVVLTHYDERYGPPKQEVLRISLGGGDVIFLEIAGVDAQFVQTRYVPIATFGVRKDILRKALDLVEAHG